MFYILQTVDSADLAALQCVVSVVVVVVFKLHARDPARIGRGNGCVPQPARESKCECFGYATCIDDPLVFPLYLHNSYL